MGTPISKDGVELVSESTVAIVAATLLVKMCRELEGQEAVNHLQDSSGAYTQIMNGMPFDLEAGPQTFEDCRALLLATARYIFRTFAPQQTADPSKELAEEINAVAKAILPDGGMVFIGKVVPGDDCGAGASVLGEFNLNTFLNMAGGVQASMVTVAIVGAAKYGLGVQEMLDRITARCMALQASKGDLYQLDAPFQQEKKGRGFTDPH